MDVDCYIGEIRLWPVGRCPTDWHFCDGTALDVASYQALFALIGTTYGGDGVKTFKLPDLRGKVPVHKGQGAGLTNRVLGVSGGSTETTLTTANLPAHTHPANISTQAGTDTTPSSSLLLASVASGAPSGTDAMYQTDSGAGQALIAMDDTSITSVGGSVSHANVMPTMSINYIISLLGTFPTQA